MSTVVNTPSDGDSSVAIVVVGLLFLVVMVVLFALYGVPALQRVSQQPNTSSIKVELPNPAPTPAPAPQPQQ